MLPRDSEAALRDRLGEPVEGLTARRAVSVMLAFYGEQRAEGVELDEDGDMLLFEWGVYSGSFQLNITRQFIVPDEDEPYQLHLGLHYAPTDALRSVGSGNRWCHEPAELAAFRDFVEESGAFRAVADATPTRVELYFEQC